MDKKKLFKTGTQNDLPAADQSHLEKILERSMERFAEDTPKLFDIDEEKRGS